MMKKVLAIIAMCWAVGMFSSAHAQERVWRMTAQEGEVRVQRPGLDMSAAVLNQALPPGVSVTTGAASRAVLENGAQRITVGANSRMSIAADSSDAMTRILEQVGSLMFQVDHRGAAHFRVETPFLAAVVKGTTFTVSAGTDQDMVHVAEGLLEVRAMNGGASRDVASGQTVQVMHNQPEIVGAVTVSVAPEATSAMNIAPVDYASASDGLIGGAVTALQNGAVSAADGAGVNVGGVGASAGLGGGGLNANANAGGLGASAGLGGGGLNANANVGGLGGVSAGAGSGGVTAGVNVGGVNAGVNVGGGGVNVNVGGLNLGLGGR